MVGFGVRLIAMNLGKNNMLELTQKAHTNKKNSVFDRIVRGEAKASRHINIIGHYDNETLIDKSGKLIKIIRLTGVDFITKSDSQLDIYKNRRNSLLKSFSSE